GNPGATQTWTPWQQVQVDIQGDFLVPVIYEGRLRLIWPVFTQQTYTPPQSSSLTASADSNGSLTADTAPPPQNYWQISLAWSELYQGTWQSKQVSSSYLTSFWSGDNEAFFRGDSPITGPLQPNEDQHVFKARVDGSDLVVDVYVRFGFSVKYASNPAIAALREIAALDQTVAETLIADSLQELAKFDFTDALADIQLALAMFTMASEMLSEADGLISSGIDEGRGPLLLGEFRFRACGDSVTVAYTAIGTPDAAEASPNQSAAVISSARLMATPSTDPYDNGARQSSPAPGTALQLWTGGLVTLNGGGFGNQPWPFTQSQQPSADKVTYLNASPSPPFQLRYSQQGWQFALQEPFFYQDAQRTFCVDTGSGATLRSRWLIDRTSIDPRLLTGITQLRTAPELPKQVAPPSGNVQVTTTTAVRTAATATRIATNGSTAATAGGAASPALLERPSTSVLAPEVAISSGLETEAPYKLLSPSNWGTIVWHGPYTDPDAELRFQTHRHPYVCKLIEKLVAAQGQC
ncbi:MAG: neuraminidase-like domain-containing protein, partial [Bryobacteraceae bacterium]